MKSMRSSPLRPFALMASALLLAGCSVLGSTQRDPVTIYSPQVRVAPDPSWPAVTWQLAIYQPSAARIVDSPRIAVRPSPSELEVYKGVGWAQPATDLVASVVLRTLEDSGKIAGVAMSSSGMRADYRLLMELRRFESDYAGQALPSATIELSAKLLHASDQRVVASRTFLQVEPAGSEDVAQVAGAFDRALEKLGGELTGWVLNTGEADARSKR